MVSDSDNPTGRISNNGLDLVCCVTNMCVAINHMGTDAARLGLCSSTLDRQLFSSTSGQRNAAYQEDTIACG